LPSSNNTPLAHGTRQILENTEFILLCSLMFGIDLIGFVLLLINDWRLVMQVNIRHSFFANPLQQPFTKVFTVWYSIVNEIALYFFIINMFHYK